MPTEPSIPKSLHPFWDRSIRFLLRRPAHLRGIVSLCSPELAERLDFEHLELLERSLVLEDYRQREVDLLIRLPYRSEEGTGEVIVYLLVEHQSTVDPLMPLRLLSYMLSFWREQRGRSESPDGPAGLPPIIPLVVHTGNRRWTASRDFRHLMAGPPSLASFAPQFDILYLGLPETPAAALESIGPIGWALRAVQRVDADQPEFAAVLERVAHAIRPLLHGEWRELVEFLVLLVRYRRPDDEAEDLINILHEAADTESRQSELIEMNKTLGKTLWEKAVDEGLAKGREEGLESGLERGLERGREEGLLACRAIVLRLGRHRFGEPNAEQRSRLESITDVSWLEEMAEAVLDAQSWDEFLRRR